MTCPQHIYTATDLFRHWCELMLSLCVIAVAVDAWRGKKPMATRRGR